MLINHSSSHLPQRVLPQKACGFLGITRVSEPCLVVSYRTNPVIRPVHRCSCLYSIHQTTKRKLQRTVQDLIRVNAQFIASVPGSISIEKRSYMDIQIQNNHKPTFKGNRIVLLRTGRYRLRHKS